MAEQIVAYIEDGLQRLRRAWAQVQTWFNGLFTLVALYALQNPVVSDRMLAFIPEGLLREAVAVLGPIAMFWLAQKGKEIDRQRTIVQARLQ